MSRATNLIQKAANENLTRFVNSRADPAGHNLNVALSNIGKAMEEIQDQLSDLKRLLDRK